MTARVAFTMRLKPGAVAEYKKRHDEIWPELSSALRETGVSDYSIFLDEKSLMLFAVQKLSEGNTATGLPHLPIVCKWWEFMSPLMETNSDYSPMTGPLREVFHLD